MARLSTSRDGMYGAVNADKFQSSTRVLVGMFWIIQVLNKYGESRSNVVIFF